MKSFTGLLGSGFYQQILFQDHFLFDKPVSPLLLASGMARDWPDARGIWFNDAKNFLVWVNEEDHMRIISMERGGNMKSVFQRFCQGLQMVRAHKCQSSNVKIPLCPGHPPPLLQRTSASFGASMCCTFYAMVITRGNTSLVKWDQPQNRKCSWEGGGGAKQLSASRTCLPG